MTSAWNGLSISYEKVIILLKFLLARYHHCHHRHSHSLTHVLTLGSRGTPSAALVISLIIEMLLEVLFDGPVAHEALEKCMLFLGL